jgi:Kelch motif
MRRSAIVMRVLALALLAGVGSAGAARPTWQRHAAMRTPRHEPAVTKSDGRVYVMGGFVEGLKAVPFVDVYDVASDAWSVGPPLPIAPITRWPPRTPASSITWGVIS